MHTWTIDHFSYHLNEELGGEYLYLESAKFSPPQFNQAKLRFYLRLHPRGDVEDEAGTKGHIPLYVHLESSNTDGVYVQMSVSVLGQPGPNMMAPRFNLKCEYFLTKLLRLK